MKRSALLLCGFACLWGLQILTESPAAAEPMHPKPLAPATAAFAADFPKLIDHEWGFRLGGFGGTKAGAPRQHVPIVFVHGNNVDADDWFVVRDDFKAAGWTEQELWAVSYNGKGGNNGTALTRTEPEKTDDHGSNFGVGAITNNKINVADVYDFVLAVRRYTGSSRVTLVTHSLGVTIARKMLKDHPELRPDVVAFVAIAGANHGTSFCPPGSEGNVVSCDEIAADTPWLAELNGPDGADETYGPTKWLTIYDGSGDGDPVYAGPTYAQSPQLKGADNRQFPHTYHNDLRISPPIIAEYRAFIESAEHGGSLALIAPPKVAAAVAAAPVLPATGGRDYAAVALLLLTGVLLLRRGALLTPALDQ